MSSRLHIASVQLNNGADVFKNISALELLIRAASKKGVQLILTPECSDNMIWPAETKIKSAYSQLNHPTLSAMQNLAKELSIEIIIGSLAIKEDGQDKLYNRSFAISKSGEIISQYDKIHLFDAILSDTEAYKESAYYQNGENAQLAKLSNAVAGLTICYDLRFAHLYRSLAKQGAQILCVPAAFSVPTGQAHWEVLLRARAIETGSYVIASGQTGSHPGDRHTYGHSMIVDPWGKIIASMGGNDETGFIDIIIDLDEVENCRASLPSLQHDKEFI